MNKCYICSCELSDKNKYTEHIIINAIGGRLKSKNIICKNCYNKIGDKMDASLAKELNSLTNYLNITRDRGEPEDIALKEKGSDLTYYISPDGKQKLAPNAPEIQIEGDKGVIKGHFNDKKELKKFLETIKSRKLPTLDIEDALEKSEVKSRFVDYEGFRITVGGEENFKSILKTAINYFIYKGYSNQYINHLIPILLNGGAEKFVYFFDNDSDTSVTAHRIFLKGESKEKVLFAVVEFFSIFSFIVLLNDNYEGIDFEEKYSYNLEEYVENSNNINLSISSLDIKKIISETNPNYGLIQKKAGIILNRESGRKLKKREQEIYEECAEEFLDKYEGLEFTEVRMNEFIECIVQKMKPLIQHLSKK